MTTATLATELKSNLKYFIDKVVNDGESIIITRPKSKNVVLISEEEYNDLLRIRENEKYMYKLQQSIAQAKEGKVIQKSIEELEEMEDE